MEKNKNNYCPCCGVEFNKDQIEIYDSFNCPLYSSTQHNFKYNCLTGDNICWWCTHHIPSGLVDVICDKQDSFASYDKKNFMEHYELKKRIEFVNNLRKESFCPRCGGECKEKVSENFFSNEKFIIKKCISCGWC